MMTLARCFALLLSTVVGGASAVSFDCRLARSPSEQLVCTDAELSGLDDELAALFARALAASDNPRDFRRRSDQAWQRRELQCTDKPCVLRWYQQRRAQLLADLGAPPAQAAPVAARASQAAGPADDLAQCLASQLGAGRHSALDGGRSARALLVACQPQSQAWVEACIARGDSRDDCAFKVAAVALDRLKAAAR